MTGGVDDRNARWERTTAGRVLFNSIIPDELGFINKTFGKRELGDLAFECFTVTGMGRTTEFLDAIKDFGFRRYDGWHLSGH